MKRIARLAIVIIGLVAVAAAAVPNLVSDDLVKRRIADRIAGLTGRAVALTGDPSLSVYPHLAVSVGGLTIANREGMGEDPFIAAESLTTRLRVLPLLLGRVEFDAFELAEPRIRLLVDGDGRTNWRRPRGDAAASTGAAARSPAAAGLGRLTVANGTIVYDNLVSNRHEEMTAIDLDVTWPEAAAALSGTGTLQWRGETVEFSGMIVKPLDLAAGDPSPARFAIGSTPLRVSFNGQLNSLDDYRLDGDASVTTPSLRRAIEWLGTPMGTGSILGAASIKGTVDWSGSTISFADAKLELDGNGAEGALSARFAGGRPRVEGSLALAKLDLSPYLEAMRANLIADGPWLIAPTSLPIADAIDADLAVSVEQMLIGPLRVGRAAISVTTTDGRAAIDVGGAQFYGGVLEARMTAAMSGEALSATAKARLAAVPARVALGDLAAIPVLDGTGTAVVAVASQGRNWGEFAQAITGSVIFAIADGSLTGVDIDALAAMASDPLAEPLGAATTATDFANMAGTLSIQGGALETNDLVAEGKDFRIAVNGWGSLLSGLIDAKAMLATVGSDEREIPLSIGGTWWQPEFAVDRERMERDGAPPRG